MAIVNLIAVLVLATVFFLAAAFVFLVPFAFTLHSLIVVSIVPVQLFNLARSKGVRQNHALEHATINILEERSEGLRLLGLSSAEGFTVFGLDDLESVKEAAASGLSRLRRGEHHLAIHRECGTGRGVIHLLSALVFLLLLLLTGRFSFAYILFALLAAALLGPFLGRSAQKFLTTTKDLKTLEIETAIALQPDHNPLSFSNLPGVQVKTKHIPLQTTIVSG